MADWFRKRVVNTIKGLGNPKLRGDVVIGAGAGIGISQTGQEIDIVNQGVTSLERVGISPPQLAGRVRLEAGTNVTLADDAFNNAIIINASGGGGGGVTSLRDGTGSSITGDIPILAGAGLQATYVLGVNGSITLSNTGVFSLRDGLANNISGNIAMLAGTGLQAAYTLGINGSVTFSNTGATSVGGLGLTAFTGAVKIEAGGGLAISQDPGNNAVIVKDIFTAQRGTARASSGTGSITIVMPNAYADNNYSIAALWSQENGAVIPTSRLDLLSKHVDHKTFELTFTGGNIAADADISWVAVGTM